MTKSDAGTLGVCAGVAGFALTLLSAAFLEWPLLTYLPQRHTWRMVAHAPPEAIPYYGLVLWGLVGGIDAAVLVYVLARVAWSRPLGRGFAALCAGWTLLALLLAAGYFVLRSWP